MEAIPYGELGVAGILIVLVLKLVFDFLSASRKGKNGPDQHKVARQIQDLWEWHNRKDDEGVMVWYVRKSLEDAIKKLAENVELQAKILQEIVQQQRADRKELLGAVSREVSK